MSVFRILICIPLLFSFTALAQTPSGLSFKTWKEQQVLDAQNQMLRISAHISQVKNGKGSVNDSKETEDLPNERVRKSSENEFVQAERELHRAQENLSAANTLKFDDYVNVYIPTLQDQPEALSKLIEKLSKEELVEVIKSLVKKGPSASDAKHKVSLLQELRVSSQANR